MTTPSSDAPTPHVPSPPPAAGTAEQSFATRSPYARAAIWVAIGALVAAALICVVWVLVGPQTGSIVRAFITVLLFAGFAGIAIMEARLAPRRPAWFAIASIATWVVALLAGIILIWMPEPWSFYGWDFVGPGRFLRFLLVVLVLQLALLHARFFLRAALRHITPINRILAPVTVGLVALLALLLLLPLIFSDWIFFAEFYWRIVVAVVILAAVGTALVPLVNLLFAPRPVGVAPAATTPAPSAPAASAEQDLLPWPMYIDGVTPLPMLPDGSPDWNAYYTGHPTPGAQIFAPVSPPPAPAAPAPAAPGSAAGAPDAAPPAPASAEAAPEAPATVEPDVSADPAVESSPESGADDPAEPPRQS